jgi:hypothetical protein
MQYQVMARVPKAERDLETFATGWAGFCDPITDEEDRAYSTMRPSPRATRRPRLCSRRIAFARPSISRRPIIFGGVLEAQVTQFTNSEKF